jgi:vancomycin resistance protein VanJ
MTSKDRREAIAVMTYNVGNGLAPTVRLLEHLRASEVDVIALQEVDAEQAAAITGGIADLYPYQVVQGTGYSGRGLLSRHPIVSHQWFHLSPDRPDLGAEIDYSGARITFVVAHPPPPRLRWRGVTFDLTTVSQIDQLAEIVAGIAPAVLLGDLNLTVRNPSYARLVDAGLVDAYRDAGVGRAATFPIRPGRMRLINQRISWMPLHPITRIDYIWHTQDLATLSAWVGSDGGSDHLPVLARLALRDDAGATDREAM